MQFAHTGSIVEMEARHEATRSELAYTEERLECLFDKATLGEVDVEYENLVDILDSIILVYEASVPF